MSTTSNIKKNLYWKKAKQAINGTMKKLLNICLSVFQYMKKPANLNGS